MHDPLHEVSSETTWWSTGNVAEAIPGVPTPLGWTLQRHAVVLGARGGFADMGVLPEAEVTRPVGVDEAPIAIFHGHAAGNVDALLRVAAAIPGNSAAALLEQLFGAAGDAPVTVPPRSMARWPAIAARLPANVVRAPGRLDAACRRAAVFRPAALARLADPTRARGVLAEARDLFAAVVRPHAFVTFVVQGLYEQMAQLATAAGRPGAELALVGGYGGMEETALASALWDVAHGRRTLDAFLADHGHHGPNEGELSTRSWREDAAPLLRAMETFRRLEPDEHPRRVEARRQSERMALEAAILARLPRRRQVGARLLLRLTRRYVPLRETGRSAFHRAVDVARAASRVAGADLARRGVLEDPEDVFFLTLDEVLRADPPAASEARESVAFRRGRRDHYGTLDIPPLWQGRPTPVPRAVVADGDGSTHLAGLAVAPGRVEGTARVVVDPAACAKPLEPGEILVCRTTDPSWVTMFLGAGALVIDIGGAMSHGAIVARELGIPCVINTQTGTTTLRTGDRLWVDGAAGTVEVLERTGGRA